MTDTPAPPDPTSQNAAPQYPGPQEPEITSDEREALDAIGALNPVVFVLGRAGTGKTHLLRRVRAATNRNAAVVAPTGIAALNAGGQTIHSFFGLPPFRVGPHADGARPRRKVLEKLDLLLIDEISMVRADLLDSIDHVLRQVRRSDAPFGDVQVVCFGDFLQLPPIVSGQDAQILGEFDYRSPYAFDAHALREAPPEIVEMRIIHRQADETFAGLLDGVRQSDSAAVEALNEACVRPHRTTAAPILLTATNRLADLYNERGLAALSAPATVYEGRTNEKFERDRYPAPPMLALKPHARVMAVRNDPAGRFVNGSLGAVVACGETSVHVAFDGRSDVLEIEPASWDSVKFDVTAEGRVAANIVGSYKQVPLIPAWAITVHKSQGLTLDDVRVDLGRGAFAPGQAYVALSRARTLEGLSLARPLTGGDVMRDPALERFA